MTSTVEQTNVPNYGRRIVWLGVAVAVVCLLYTAGWFWAARKLETTAVPALANAHVACDNLTSGGFPFRIGLFCDRTSFADRGITAKAGAFRSAAQIYAPTTVVGELEGPAQIEVPGLPPLGLTWTNLRASSHLAQPLPTRSSLEAKELTVSGPDGQLGTAEDAQAHFRTNGPDIDVALSFTKLVLPTLPNGGTLPAADTHFVAKLKNGVADLQTGRDSLRERSGEITTLEVRLGPEGGLALNGPFSIDADGLLDANLQLTAQDPQALAGSLASVFPDKADEIRTALTGLALLGAQTSLPLVIEKGEARLAFVKLGEIEPLQ